MGGPMAPKPAAPVVNVVMANPRNKIRRITQEDEITTALTSTSTKLRLETRVHNFIEELPNELLGLILDYCPKQQVYPILRNVSR